MPKARKSISRTFVTYLILVGMIPLLIGWGLVYFYGQQSVRETIGSNFQEFALETAHQVDQVLNQKYSAHVYWPMLPQSGKLPYKATFAMKEWLRTTFR